MARRRVFKKKCLTFDQLDAVMARHKKRAPPGEVWARLYGNVMVSSLGNTNRITLRYYGKRCHFTIAHVYKGSEGDTLYVVYGVGHQAAKQDLRGDYSDAVYRKRAARWRPLWRRYAPMVTPLNPGEVLGAITVGYRIHDGVITPCGIAPADPKQPGTDRPGVWLAIPNSYVISKKDWSSGIASHLYPRFARRCALFVTRLRQSLAGGPPCVVQLLSNTTCDHFRGQYWRKAALKHGDCACVSVCTPPTRTENGRRLRILITMHDRESRKFFRIDGDYGQKHCHYMALEDGKGITEQMQWKCGNDAIAGIREWIFGDIYIPGPG